MARPAIADADGRPQRAAQRLEQIRIPYGGRGAAERAAAVDGTLCKDDYFGGSGGGNAGGAAQ